MPNACAVNSFDIFVCKPCKQFNFVEKRQDNVLHMWEMNNS
jgi:hypothetical protein